MGSEKIGIRCRVGGRCFGDDQLGLSVRRVLRCLEGEIKLIAQFKTADDEIDGLVGHECFAGKDGQEVLVVS